MAVAVEVPKLGNTVEECLISRWVKRKGETVSAGDTVAEIETDKATFEVTAPESGTLLETFFEEGALVPVFTNLFVIGAAGENAEAFRPDSIGAHTESVSTVVPKPGPSAEMSLGAAGTSARATKSLSPRARRFAEQHNFHPSTVDGSGPGGRVLERDLRALYETRRAPRVSSIREKIARRMRESLASTAQYTLHSWAEAGGLMRVRARVKQSPRLPDININDLVTFCVIEALIEVPEVNAEFVDGQVRLHPEVNIGFACDTPRGLLVPVVRLADELPIDELAVRMKELAAKAVAGSISADDLSGATFTISNLGAYGVESFTPLLNPPQVAILGLGAIGLKPVRKSGTIEFVDSIALSLTCDHQVIDGAPGARFLKVVRERIESIESFCPI
jgi:pyruvate dehydrogenase E2 component (dihydrolipoamide acetyltransferase)